MALARDGEVPTLVLDAGTGLRRFSKYLGDEPFQGRILLGHLHLDHVQGLPFFPAAAHPASVMNVLLPAQGDPEQLLAGPLSPPSFPLRPSELQGSWRFSGLEPGEIDLAGFRVLALEIPHGGGRTFGFRISDGTSTIAYLSDHSPFQLGLVGTGSGSCTRRR